jgi:hypothetical protein
MPFSRTETESETEAFFKRSKKWNWKPDLPNRRNHSSLPVEPWKTLDFGAKKLLKFTSAFSEHLMSRRALPLVALLACLVALVVRPTIARPTGTGTDTASGTGSDDEHSTSMSADRTSGGSLQGRDPIMSAAAHDDDHLQPSHAHSATATASGDIDGDPSEPDDLLAAFDEAMHAQHAARTQRHAHAAAFRRIAADPNPTTMAPLAPLATQPPSAPIVVRTPPTAPPRRYAPIGANAAFDPFAAIAWLWSPRARARQSSILDAVACETRACAEWRARFRRERNRPCTLAGGGLGHSMMRDIPMQKKN